MGWLRTKKKESIPSTMHNLLVQSFGQVRKDVQNVYDWLKFLYNQNTFQQQLLEDQRREIQDLKAQIALMPQNKEEVKALIDAYYDLEPVIQHVEEMEDRVLEVVKRQKTPELPISEVAEQVKDEINHEVTAHFESATEQIRKAVEAELREELNSAFSERIEQIEAREPAAEVSPELNQRLSEIMDQLNRLAEKQRQTAPEPQIQQAQPIMAPPVQRQTSALKEKLMRSLTRNSKEYIKNTIFNLIKKYQKISGLQLREIVVEEQGLVSRSSFYRLLGELEHEQQGLSVVQHGKEKIYIFQAAPEPTIDDKTQF